MPVSRINLALAWLFAAVAGGLPAGAQPAPVLNWITNSSIKLDQIIGDIDWEAQAQGSNLPTASQTVSRFHILGNDMSITRSCDPWQGRFVFLCGSPRGVARCLARPRANSWHPCRDAHSGRVFCGRDLWKSLSPAPGTA